MTSSRGAIRPSGRPSRLLACCAAPGSTYRSALSSPTPRRSACWASASTTGVYWAGRTTLVRRIEDVPLYDRAFGAFWLAAARRRLPPPRSRRSTSPCCSTTRTWRKRTRARRRGARRHHRALQRARGAAPQGLRRVHPPPSSTRRAGSWPTCASPARCARRGASVARGARRAGPTSVARCARRSVPAASPSGASGSTTTSGPGGSCCCATSADRWSRTPAR